MNKNKHKDHHIPVLLHEVLDILGPQKGENYLDATAGYGGHAAAILECTTQGANSVLVDRDENAIKVLKRKFADSGASIRHGDFAHIAQDLVKEGKQFDMIFADLGLSSPHIDNPHRGFSFLNDGPLDMRMDSNQTLTAEHIVNHESEASLAKILREYGEEPKYRRITAAIIAARPITTTKQLAEVVERAVKVGWKKTHPATKTFQALRIAVNDELGQLRTALPLWLKLLKPGGRLAIVSFHSLEDRLVKQFFQEHAGDRYDAEMRNLTKKPIVCGTNELVFNPRARSAKLRAAVKIKNQKEGVL